MKSGIRNVTIDFSPEQGDGEDANRHAVVEKRKTCGAKEFRAEPEIGRIASRSSSPRPRHGELEATRSADPGLPVAETTPSEEKAIAERSHAPTTAEDPRGGKPQRATPARRASGPQKQNRDKKLARQSRHPAVPELCPPRRASRLGFRPRLGCHPRRRPRRPRRPRSPLTLALVGHLLRCGSWR